MQNCATSVGAEFCTLPRRSEEFPDNSIRYKRNHLIIHQQPFIVPPNTQFVSKFRHHSPYIPAYNIRTQFEYSVVSLSTTLTCFRILIEDQLGTMCLELTDYHRCGHRRRTRILECDRPSYRRHVIISDRGTTSSRECSTCEQLEPATYYRYRYRYYSREYTDW